MGRLWGLRVVSKDAVEMSHRFTFVDVEIKLVGVRGDHASESVGSCFLDFFVGCRMMEGIVGSKISMSQISISGSKVPTAQKFFPSGIDGQVKRVKVEHT